MPLPFVFGNYSKLTTTPNWFDLFMEYDMHEGFKKLHWIL